MGKIIQVAQAIFDYTNKGDRLRNVLNKGLSILEIDEKLKNFERKIPEELKDLYQWHNGTNINSDLELFYYHYFLSLEESLEIYHEWMGFNQKERFCIYPENLLPIFGFEGEYYAIECFRDEQKTGKIWHIFHDQMCVYDSLYLMLKSFLEAYEKEAYKIVLVDNYWETEVNEQLVSEIKLKYNPVRHEVALELREQNEYFYYP
ncbi:SMI1/KNR4 family protein [Cyanobacterium stanieri]|nr:SMI1/KNR4 family protein [Cyanobacterium stanieri]